MEEVVKEETRICLYPFLSAASKHVEESGVTLEDLISSAVFERARLRGKERIIEAIKGGAVRKLHLLDGSDMSRVNNLT